MKTKKCPYYIVNNEEEFAKVLKALGTSSSREPLYPFPCIVGKDGIIFQSDAKDYPMSECFDKEESRNYVYELKTLE